MEHYQRFTLGNVIINFEHVAYITRDAGDTVTIHLTLNNGAPLSPAVQQRWNTGAADAENLARLPIALISAPLLERKEQCKNAEEEQETHSEQHGRGTKCD
jgi:hypothetical protein